VLDGKTPKIKWDSQAALGIVLASNGYPESYEKGVEIKGLENIENVQVFQMGTRTENGKLLTNGGRVLFITALADNLKEARTKVLKEISKIECENLFYRKDIGYQVIK
jgi:phosphoribosylamine--glycine ligase